MLYRNLGALIEIYADDPDQIGVFYDVQLLQEAGTTDDDDTPEPELSSKLHRAHGAHGGRAGTAYRGDGPESGATGWEIRCGTDDRRKTARTLMGVRSAGLDESRFSA